MTTESYMYRKLHYEQAHYFGCVMCVSKGPIIPAPPRAFHKYGFDGSGSNKMQDRASVYRIDIDPTQ